MVVAMNEKERERFTILLREMRGDNSIRGFCSNGPIHYAAWRQWEAGQSVPGYENLEKVAAMRGWSMDQLLAYLRTGDSEESPIDIESVVTYIKGLPQEKKMSLIKRLL